MRLLRPEALWLLLAAVPLVLLHLRRLRRRDVPVASVRLWRELAAAGGGRRGLRRLRETGALSLLLLALAALTLALAEPVTGAAAPPPRDLVVVLDGSVTMNAEGDGARRFDLAREAAADAVRRAPDGAAVTIWLADGSPWVLAGPTRDRERVASALAGAAPTLERRCLAAALDGARAARELAGEPATFLVVTDAPGAASLPETRDALVAAVGEPAARNAEIRSVDETPRGVRVVMAAREGGAHERSLRIAIDGVPVAEVPVALDEGRESAPEVLLPTGASGRLEARLHPPDDFPEDDACGVLLERRAPLRVLVVAPGASPAAFLVEALRSMPRLVDSDAALLADADVAADVIAAADVVVADGVLPAAIEDGESLRRPLLAFVESGERLDKPLLWGVGNHPVLDGVDLAPLRLDRATALRPRPGEVVLVDSAAGPLAVAGERGGVRSVRLGFRAEASTLPLEPAFPLLVRNALRWLRDADGLPPAVTAGEPLPLRSVLPPGAVEVVLSLGERARAVPLGPDGADPATPLPRPGGSRVLRVGLSGGAALGETVVRWSLPGDVRLGASSPGPSPGAALAALARPPVPARPERPLAPWLSALAAVALLLGAALLSRGAPAGAAARPVSA